MTTDAERPTYTVEDLTIALNTVDRPEFLRAALASLLETTPPGVTLQILFNSSSQATRDATIEQAQAWNGPTRFIHHEQILPIDESHNAALAAVETPLVNFMGDDDLVLDERITRIIETFNATDPVPSVVTSFARRIAGSPDDPVLGSNKDLGPTTVDEWRAWHASGKAFEILWPGAVLRTDLLREIGGWEPDFALSFDNRIFSQMSFHGPVLAVPDRSFGFRIHQNSLSTSKWSDQRHIVRFVAACQEANVEGRPEPTAAEFRAAEDNAPLAERVARNLRDRSGLHFRVGGAKALSGDRFGGATHLARAAVLYPPAFFDKVLDQYGKGSLDAADSATVVILLKNSNQYRVAFYGLLREELREHGISLRLIFSDGLDEDRAKGDQAAIDWAERRPMREISVRGSTLLWQPAFDAARDADLIITEQASKQLFNIVLVFGQRFLKTRHAFWGHGKNFHAPFEGGDGEGLKRKLTSKAHWFFAYNALSRDAAIDAGMPADRVTSVMNSTDTRRIREVMAALPSDNDAQVRAEVGIGSGPVVTFIGGLYPHKRPEFLVEAAKHLRQLVPDVEFLVIGSGSLAHFVADAAETNDWIHMMGAQYGDERVRLASVATLQMMPGMVGLNIVDAFALGLPTVTTDIAYHSPEIDYLEEGVNGITVSGDPTPVQYATAVAELLGDTERLSRLRDGAYASGSTLSAEDMASRFCEGVRAALAAPRR